MVSVNVSACVPFEAYIKTCEYGLNRSKISREAIIKAVKDFEKDHGIVDDGSLEPPVIKKRGGRDVQLSC